MSIASTIKTNQWNEEKQAFLEVDTVAHFGRLLTF